jgi:hypothetical protein
MNRNKLLMIFLFGAHVLLVQSVRSQNSAPASSPTISPFPGPPTSVETALFAKPKVSDLLTQTLVPTDAQRAQLRRSMDSAQTGKTTTEEKIATQRTKTTETASGTVTTTYESGKIIVVSSESGQDTFGFVLDQTVRYVNKAGREIDEKLIKPGTPIHLYYEGTGQTRVVNHIVVDRD